MKYTREQCLKGLQLEDSEYLTEKMIKKQYYKLALLYHPDKNIEQNTKEQFHHISECYESLMKHEGYLDYGEEEESNDEESVQTTHWMTQFYPFFQNELFLNLRSTLLHSVVKLLYGKCESQALELLQKLDHDKLDKILGLLKSQKDNFHISNMFLEKLESLIQEKKDKKKIIILRPKLQDIMDMQVYKLVEEGQTFYIPLWHHELIYELENRELVIQIIPKLDDNIEIDEKNNLFLYENFHMKDLLDKREQSVFIGNYEYKFQCENLKMKKRQQLKLNGEGLPCLSSQNIYDVSKKGHVYLCLTIYT